MSENGTGCIVCGAPVEFPEYTALCPIHGTVQRAVGCIICGAPVEFPEYTLECNKCYEANLRYANREDDECTS